MKTILVPIDFSKCAANALRYALEIAAANDAEILALHVVFPNEGVENNVYSAFWIDEYFKQREHDLNTWVRRHTRKENLKKVRTRSQCTIGFPAASIGDVVAKEGVDMVVMGTTGATGLRGVFLGSVASGVIAHTKVPVLVVPQKAAYKNNAKAVFATDFHIKVSDASLGVLRSLPQLKSGFVHVVHVQDKPGTTDKSHESTLGQKLGEIPHDFHYLHDRDIIQAVMNFTESTDADLLVAVAHEHSLLHRLFYDSMTRKLAQRTNLPILALHDKG